MIKKLIHDFRIYLSYRKGDTGGYPVLTIEIILRKYLPRQMEESVMVLYEQSIQRWILKRRR